jgi:hypothetical protein
VNQSKNKNAEKKTENKSSKTKSNITDKSSRNSMKSSMKQTKFKMISDVEEGISMKINNYRLNKSLLY